MPDSLDGLVAQATSDQLKEHKATIRRLQRKLQAEQERTAAITEAIYEAVHDGLASLEVPDFTPPPRDPRTDHDEYAVAVLSDWQLGKKTPTYSSAVCETRIRLFAEKLATLVEIQRQDHPVRRLVLFLVGDMIEGELIFPGQAYHIDASLYHQVTIDGPRILGGLIHWAAQFFEEVEIYAVPGNHGYLGGRSRRDMHPASNGDRMLYQIVSRETEHLGLTNVSWTIAEDWWLVADLGDQCRFFLLHGEDVRGYAGIPWYGWTRKVMGVSSLERIWPEMEYDHMVAGHFHTPISMFVNGRRLWINASTESHNPYAARQLSAAGEPAQWLLFVKPGRGVTAEYLVDLSET